MKLYLTLLLRICLFVFCSGWIGGFANNAVYEQRRIAYIDTALAHFGWDAITLQAYRGLPLDTGVLNSTLRALPTALTNDFDIVKLIRILYFDTLHRYDSIILPVINPIPYWLTANDTKRTYWSENHMALWMSCDWLLHEKYGHPVDSALDKRLRHYLQLKIQYGFYEFFSSVYSPYCLAGLLNLADFAQDAQIKSLATQASQRLLREMLMLTNDKGTYFPAAGRNYYGKYMSAYGQNHNNLIYLLTGFGQPPGYGSHAGSFLASSTIPVDSIISSWVPTLDTLYHIGHSLDTGFILNHNMDSVDKTIFQWSSGAYFEYKVALETYWLLTDSNLWQDADFSAFAPLSAITPGGVTSFAQGLSCITESSVICQEDVAIFKHKSVTLSSAQNFWKGDLGYQQFPCVANVGTTAVLTAAGKVIQDWNSRPATNASSDLPYVKQKKNIALLMYNPNKLLASFGYYHPQVTLFWTNSDYDEVRNDSMWLLGRQGNGYVAVRRSCTGTIDSMMACSNPTQSWVIMVGDSDMYGSFNNFQNLIDHSQFTESWYYDSVAQQNVYYAKIVVDTTTIEYAWGVDSAMSGIQNVSADLPEFKIYPNPANDVLNVELANMEGQGSLEIYNTNGEIAYRSSITERTMSIPTRHLSAGVYAIKLYTASGQVASKRFVVSH